MRTNVCSFFSIKKDTVQPLGAGAAPKGCTRRRGRFDFFEKNQNAPAVAASAPAL